MKVELRLISNPLLKHNDDLLTEEKHWITYTPYVKYFKQTFLFQNRIISETPIMMYMSFPGFITIEPLIHNEITPRDEEEYNQGMRYVNHEYDLIKPKGIKKQNTRLNKDDSIKKVMKGSRRMIKTWNMIMNSMGSDVFQNENRTYQVILKNTDCLVNLDNRSDIYYPMCFKEDGKIVGGLYASAWETASEGNNLHKNIKFDVFTTGGCLFGNEVFGFDDHGKCHPLTNPRHEMPEAGIIQRIEYISDKHSDEILTVQSFKNLFPFFKTFSSVTHPKVIYHLPACEYILNAISLYMRNKITTQACLDYIELISLKKRDHANKLHKIAAQNGIDIQFDSPLDPLINQLKKETDIIAGLLKLTALPLLNIFENEKLVFDKIVEYLSHHSGKYKPVWIKIKDLIKEGKIDETNTSIANLSHLSYCANLATPNLDNANAKVCCIVPGHEKRVQLSYKHLLSETFGSVFCINWLPPILIKSEEHYNAIFFINNKLNKKVKSILDLNIVDHIFKSIGGLAIDDRQYVLQQMEEIFLLLCAIHPRKTIEKILKSLVANS